MANRVTKPCEGNCGKILEDVYPTRRFCNACQIKKSNKKRGAETPHTPQQRKIHLRARRPE